MIKVMVVEDSVVVREFLLHVFNSAPGISVVGAATNGEEAVRVVERLKPDVITMDIHMPIMNGLEATRRIMETYPVPIIIVSGTTNPGDVDTTFRAMEAGAVAFLQRPAGIGHPDHEADTRKLLQMVRSMSEVKMVRRWPSGRHKAIAASPPPTAEARTPQRVNVVAIGASTGGPPVLQTILAGLPANFPVPVLVVQHMAPGFVQGFAEWLSRSSALPVQLAMQGELLLPSRVYIAPDKYQMGVVRSGKISLVRAPSENGLCPSVSYLFRSVAEVYAGHAVAGLLTGMGRDGASELKQLREAGAVTFAQDQESSVVHGMPGEAIKLDAATYVLAPGKIAPLLTSLANNNNRIGNGTL